jgi:hypothetical protein
MQLEPFVHVVDYDEFVIWKTSFEQEIHRIYPRAIIRWFDIDDLPTFPCAISTRETFYPKFHGKCIREALDVYVVFYHPNFGGSYILNVDREWRQRYDEKLSRTLPQETSSQRTQEA